MIVTELGETSSTRRWKCLTRLHHDPARQANRPCRAAIVCRNGFTIVDQPGRRSRTVFELIGASIGRVHIVNQREVDDRELAGVITTKEHRPLSQPFSSECVKGWYEWHF